MRKTTVALAVSLALVSNVAWSYVSKQRLQTLDDLSELSETKPDLYVYDENGKAVENYDHKTKGGEFKIDGAYGVDTTKHGVSGKNISMNIYNADYATASLKIYDANGNVTETIMLSGNAPETSILKSVFSLKGLILNDFVGQSLSWAGEYEIGDTRLGSTSGKNEIKDVFVPEGGKIEISKNSPEAILTNVVDIALSDIAETVKKDLGDDLWEKLALHLTDTVIREKLKTGITTKLEFKDLVENIALESIDFIVKNQLEEANKKLLKKLAKKISKKKLEEYLKNIGKATLSSLLAWAESAEAVAKVLDAAGKVLDITRYDNKNDIIIPLASCSSNPLNSYCNGREIKLQLDLNLSMLNKTAAIATYAASHVGAAPAAYYSRDVANYKRTLKESEFYTKGTVPIKAPVDIVLNWGERPADLDSHLTGPMEDNGNFHVWYGSRGSLDNAPYVLLYRDDTSHGHGSTLPEQTRINTTPNGIYNFYVHDYSNAGNPNSRALSQSDAVVTIHSAGDRNKPEGQNLGKPVALFNVPEDKVGTVWHAFTINTANGTVSPRDQIHPNTSVITGGQSLSK